jgi:D-alanine-D-alanine ligase
VTAGSVLAAIDPAKYDVVPIGITPEGKWVLESAEPERLRITASDKLPEVDGSRAEVSLIPDNQQATLVVHESGHIPEAFGNVDVVFPVLHGPWGEDGTIQGLLEMVDVRYVGSGVLASAVGMDKHYMKLLYAAEGLPVLPFVVATDRDWRNEPERIREEVAALGFPVFVKPCRGGSSIGISKVRDASELDAAMDEARRWDPKVIIEASAGVGAREIECGVLGSLGGATAEASVVAEISIDSSHDFYDFAAKYLPEEHTRLDVPAKVDDAVSDEVRALAVKAFEVLSCEGLARVDFFLLDDGRVVLNEINTMPGFTPTSMFPLMWAATGVSYPEVVERLIQLALERRTGLR